MEWLQQNLGGPWTFAGVVVLLGVIAAGFRKYGLPVWKLYRAAKADIHETQEQRADGYQDLTALKERQLVEVKRECEELKKEARELRRDLTDQVRAVLVRDNINRQDQAYIRGLQGRLRENRIDFADITESIQRQFRNEQ